MNISESFSVQMSKVVQSVRDTRRLTRLKYSPAERTSLTASLRAQGNQADMLGFHVNYLDHESFRYALREVFFKFDYVFEADTDSPTILDCGANIGLTTLFFKRLYPKARISCFEADPTTATILKKNIDQNRLQDVVVHNLMLSASDGERPFYIDDSAPGSLRMSGVPGFISNHREILVKTGRLSDYVNGPVDLLKLDVEGAEFEVLGDLKSSGKIAHIRRMVIEYHHRIDGQTSCLAGFLALLEAEGFDYQISGDCHPITQQNVSQNFLIGAYRRLN